MTRFLIAAGVAAVAVVASAPPGAASQDVQPPAPIVIEGKFDTSTDHVLIPVTIGGHRFWCNPDSGYSALISLDEEEARAAGLPISGGVPTPDGNPPSPGDGSTRAVVVVGGVTFADYTVIVRPFPEQAPDMDCIMGIGLLRRFVVEFDHLAPRIVLYERASYTPPAGTEHVPLVFRTNPNVPYLDIQMAFADGSRQELRVVPDTGASYYAAVVVGQATTRVQTRVPRTARAITYADPRITQLLAARPSAITVGPFAVREPVIAVVDGSLGGGGISDGLLGSGFLKRFTVGFDFEGRRMYLRPNSRLSEPHAFDASGVAFIRRGGRHVVYAVIADSPASDAGLRAGDVLLEVDGRAATSMTPAELRDVMTVAGTTRRLVVEREQQTLTVAIALRMRV